MVTDSPADSSNIPFRRGIRWRRKAFLAREAIGNWAALDVERISLWSPVAIGLGVGLYFGLQSEPAWFLSVICLGLFISVALWAPPWRKAAIGFALVCLGFAAADWRAHSVAAPQLARETGIVDITGRLLSVEENAIQRRLVIALTSVEGLTDEETPARIRVTWRGDEFNAVPGDVISIRAGLRPPPAPALPGGFDFARQLYFQKIGAVGFAVSPPITDESAHKTRRQKLSAHVESLRLTVFRRIIDVTKDKNGALGEGGAIVAAVVTGKREAVSLRAEVALRDAGLAHLLAISGLHMGLAAGLIFFTVRFGLALIEPIALRYPIKKWAAAAALCSGLFYLILSGGGWSARRAFIMTAIMFIAILVDRRALSLRNVAIAAAVILLMTPEALFHPGFQMSFAAVAALIAGYEWASGRADPHRSFTMPAQIKRYAAGLAATDVIAAVATAPYALYHFNRTAIYSLPANMAAMPLMGFWVVPAAVLALCLTPFGWDAWAWRFAALGMDTILAIASEVSSWQGAVSLTPQWPLSVLLVLTFGGLWLCLSRAPWRLGGLIALPASVGIVATANPPDVFVAASGTNAGFVVHDDKQGALVVYSTRRNKFASTMWTEAVGLDPMDVQPRSMDEVLTCDPSGCAGALPQGLVASFIEGPQALSEDCARADVVVAFFPVSGSDWRACNALLIDRRSIWRRGAHALWISNGGDVVVKTAKDIRGRRPWTGD